MKGLENDWWTKDWTLHDFYWAAQPNKVHIQIISYLNSWNNYFLADEITHYRGKANKLKPDRTILLLCGPNHTGKTELLARGITRYMVLNFGVKSPQYVYWPRFIDDQLNDKQIEINWDAQLLIIDDFDGRRPIPRKLSAWLLEKMIAYLKPRAEMVSLPTIIISNRQPHQLINFFSTSPEGESNEDTIQAAKTLLSAINRHSFATVELDQPPQPKISNEALRQQARETNDMATLGFPAQINGKDTEY